MLTTVKGIYEKGKITLSEEPPVDKRTEVIVTFLQEQEPENGQKRVPGALKGKVNIPEDFNEPLNDLKEYT